jgi:hypothetical protein
MSGNRESPAQGRGGVMQRTYRLGRGRGFWAVLLQLTDLQSYDSPSSSVERRDRLWHVGAVKASLPMPVEDNRILRGLQQSQNIIAFARQPSRITNPVAGVQPANSDWQPCRLVTPWGDGPHHRHDILPVLAPAFHVGIPAAGRQHIVEAMSLLVFATPRSEVGQPTCIFNKS